MKYCNNCKNKIENDNVKNLCVPCYLKPKPQWSAEAKELIEWGYWYLNKLTITKDLPFYLNLKKEIEQGAGSKYAQSGELVAKLKKMKQLVDKEIASSPHAYQNFKG